jgi:hypothetical protein
MIKYFCDVCSKELDSVDLHTFRKDERTTELCRVHYEQIITGTNVLEQKHRAEKATLWADTFAAVVEPIEEPVVEPVVEPAVEPVVEEPIEPVVEEDPPVEGGV